MITHLQQILASGFLLLFGVISLRVWRFGAAPRRDRPALAWGVTSAYFIVGGGYSTVHALLAAASGVLGYDSPFGRWVVSWVFAANLARGVLSMAYALLLVAVMLLPLGAAARLVRFSTAGFALLAVLVTAATLRIPVSLYGLSTGLAVLSMFTAILMMGALLAAILNDGMDQLLWSSLALYAFKETTSVSLFAVLAWWTVSADRQVWHIYYWGAAALAAGMSVLASRRLRLAVEGRRVPALFERLYTLRRSPAA